MKIKVTDKRGVQEPSAGADVPSGSPLRSAAEEAALEAGSSSASRPTESSTSSTEGNERSGRGQGPPSSGGSSESEPPENDFLDDLKRLQADFDNYRKRMMRESAEASDRATGRVVEELLPVLDNFERAIAHGEGGEGVQLVFKDLRSALERLGVEEIPAEGASFDPNVHEAMELRDTDGLEEPTVIEVYRRGYMLKDRLIRPAAVVVGRPAEKEDG